MSGGIILPGRGTSRNSPPGAAHNAMQQFMAQVAGDMQMLSQQVSGSVLMNVAGILYAMGANPTELDHIIERCIDEQVQFPLQPSAFIGIIQNMLREERAKEEDSGEVPAEPETPAQP